MTGKKSAIMGEQASTEPEANRHTPETIAEANTIDTNTTRVHWPPSEPAYTRREVSSASSVLLITLALLLIVASLGLITYSATRQYGSSIHAVATIEVKATQHTQQTAQARAQATANVLGTAQAQILNTATAQANDQAAATAAIDDATATANAYTDVYTQATNGTPTLDDDLTDNTGKGKWDEGATPDGHTGCTFTDNAYHVQEAQQAYLQACFAQGTNFTNFAYTAQFTVNKGILSQAGLLLRGNSDQQSYYFFHIGTDSSYAFDLYTGRGQVKTLARGINSAITPGIGQSNQLAIIARGDYFLLYANNQYLDAAADGTLASGKIGVAVIDVQTPVDAQYSGVQVWKLSS